MRRPAFAQIVQVLLLALLPAAALSAVVVQTTSSQGQQPDDGSEPATSSPAAGDGTSSSSSGTGGTANSALPPLVATANFQDGSGASVVATFLDVPTDQAPNRDALATVLDPGATLPPTLTLITIEGKNLPDNVNFTYHIHEAPVSGTDCASTKEHWDKLQVNPRFRGGNSADYTPDPARWTTFESGDLAGRMGALTSQASRKQIYDPTIATQEFQALSFVVHGADKKRVACTNMARQDSSAGSQLVGAVLKNQRGPGTVQVEFREVDASSLPDAAFKVLPAGTPRPAAVVQATIAASGLDPSLNYKYHIHERRIDGTNCSTAKDHWDQLQVNPRFRGGNSSDYKPIPADWTTYESGDLSGKYTALYAAAPPRAAANVQANASPDATVFTVVALDPAIRLRDFANLSVVLHLPNSDRIACANLAPLAAPLPTLPEGNAPNTRQYSASHAIASVDHAAAAWIHAPLVLALVLMLLL